MVFLEMSRDEHHGGGTWAFSHCVWAPTEKKGGGKWPFWEKILSIRTGDVVLHLRGKSPNAFFVGYSTASSDGFETSRRPPNPDEWSYSSNYYRADLTGFVPFASPISLTKVFGARKVQLELYFEKNKSAGSSKRNIFYVIQAQRIQCLNGAYLSEVDDELFELLLGRQVESTKSQFQPTDVETDWAIRELRVRIGQRQFSRRIREAYNSTCCFPGCEISDPRFLVASHIARWSDNKKLRGNLSNGLCMCLIHDKAFELGLFTLTEKFEVFLNPKYAEDMSSVIGAIGKHAGQRIKAAGVTPLDEALLEHWIRTDQTPTPDKGMNGPTA